MFSSQGTQALPHCAIAGAQCAAVSPVRLLPAGYDDEGTQELMRLYQTIHTDHEVRQPAPRPPGIAARTAAAWPTAAQHSPFVCAGLAGPCQAALGRVAEDLRPQQRHCIRTCSAPPSPAGRECERTCDPPGGQRPVGPLLLPVGWAERSGWAPARPGQPGSAGLAL